VTTRSGFEACRKYQPCRTGMPDFVFTNSYGFWGPKSLPKTFPVIHAVMRQASESPDIAPAARFWVSPPYGDAGGVFQPRVV